MKKLKKTVIVLLAIYIFSMLLLSFISYGFKWPYLARTKKVQGRIVDAGTGGPVKNVIVTPLWKYYVLEISAEGGDSRVKGGSVVITDENGSFTIPGRTIFRLWPTEPLSMNLYVTHPLYHTAGQFHYGVCGRVYMWKANLDENVKEEDGKWVFKTPPKLTSLRDKYVGGVETAEGQGEKKRLFTKYGAVIASHSSGWYWQQLKKRGLEFELEETFNEWDSIYNEMEKNMPEEVLKAWESYVGGRIEKTKIKIKSKFQKTRRPLYE